MILFNFLIDEHLLSTTQITQTIDGLRTRASPPFTSEEVQVDEKAKEEEAQFAEFATKQIEYASEWAKAGSRFGKSCFWVWDFWALWIQKGTVLVNVIMILMFSTKTPQLFHAIATPCTGT